MAETVPIRLYRGTRNGLEALAAATDNAAAIFWHKSMVRHAEGHAKVIINREAPGYLGSTILEAVVRFGATYDRPDQKGIVALVETNA